MLGIPIQAIPNQSFSISLGGNLYAITLKTTNGVMCASVSRNNVVIIQNSRALPFSPLLPYHYEESGNFIFTTANFQLPQYQRFNVTQFLYYATQDEIDAVRALYAGSWFYNPIAAYPLRYKPQGYTLAP